MFLDASSSCLNSMNTGADASFMHNARSFDSSVISSSENVDVRRLNATTIRALVRSDQESSFAATSSNHPSLMTTRELPGPSSLGSPGLDSSIEDNFGNPIPRQSYAPSRSQVQQAPPSGRGHSRGVGRGRAAQEVHCSPQTLTSGGDSLGVGSSRAAQDLHFSPLARAASCHDVAKLPCEGEVEGACTSSSRSSSLSSDFDAEVRLVGVTANRNVALGYSASGKSKFSTRWRDSLSVKDTLLLRERGLPSYGSLAHPLGNCSPCIFQFRFNRGDVQFPCWNKMLCDRCHQPHNTIDFARNRREEKNRRQHR